MTDNQKVEKVCAELRLVNQEMQTFLDHRAKISKEPERLQILKERHDRLLAELNELTGLYERGSRSAEKHFSGSTDDQ